ncbi:MAG: hypothetical protein ACJAQ2_002261 [Vicingaceae bacterium]|jgi:hypothetical protein
MRQIQIIIFSCFLSQLGIAQSDSVYLSIESKLISEIQIITPNGEYGIRENYIYFKYRYWLDEVDTVSMSRVYRTELDKSKKKKNEYQKFGVCDSIINQIRNSSQYWKMRSDIDKVARKEIGYGNDEFNNLQNSESNRLKDFSNKCQDEFKVEVSELNKQLLKGINRIKEEKIDRYLKLKTSPISFDSNEIASFLNTFDLCDTDQKSLELIIIQNPADFVTSVDKLSDLEFYTFTFSLDNFPDNSKISEMKESLKRVPKKSKRTRKIIRKIKTTKG